ncbi:LLM class flavin-dependent oxidoreductase [Ornithinibacillus scapharcae]|uniref:LLM class flavin-dependent oxidoreductase n=1 Tax=Ornithinibacillus scapharcae TaxID=1147159 RepID=UPI000225BC28|nr:LLM class flavin-dependent oxidoreductase [Ornithinibacillus scapharcae]
MKLSILDQSPIAVGKTHQEALLESINLAELGEELGYYRYWIAEHHDLDGLACPAPEIMLGMIGKSTSQIRIGAGAILLPHYKPFKIAETFNLLATIFPDRIDLGLGRSPGGSAEVSMALSGNFLENVRRFPELLDELTNFLNRDFEEENMYAKINPVPVPDISPVPWLLGTSEKSAILAAEKGLNYAFGHFMSDQDATPILSTYKRLIGTKHPKKEPKIIFAVNVICAESTDEAERIALDSFLWRKRNSSNNTAFHHEPSGEELNEFHDIRSKMIIGSPTAVKEKLLELQRIHEVEEFMILTNTTSYEARNMSYKLLSHEVKKS